MPERALYPCLETDVAAAQEGRGPAPGDDGFTDAMAHIAAATSVVTTLTAGAEPVGATVTSAVGISAEPPIIGVALGWQSRTLAAIRATRVFAVNMLRSPAHEAARLFGTKGGDKFEGVTWLPTSLGPPWLPTLSLSALTCRLLSEIPAGDHAFLLGAVAHVYHAPSAALGTGGEPERPLLYWRRGYHPLGDELDTGGG